MCFMRGMQVCVAGSLLVKGCDVAKDRLVSKKVEIIIIILTIL